MKIIVKLPIKEGGKFKLQSRGLIEGKQYKTANGLMEGLEAVLHRKLSAFLGTGLKEKIAIVVKEYMDGSFENINESLDSDNSEYLIYSTVCFLEEFLSDWVLSKYEDRWTKHVMGGGAQE